MSTKASPFPSFPNPPSSFVPPSAVSPLFFPSATPSSISAALSRGVVRAHYDRFFSPLSTPSFSSPPLSCFSFFFACEEGRGAANASRRDLHLLLGEAQVAVAQSLGDARKGLGGVPAR